MRKSFTVALYLALAVVSTACGSGSPTSPSGGANPPPTPSARAEIGTVVVWEGSPSCYQGCSPPAKQLTANADGSYDLKAGVGYTLEYGIKNPGVPGRCIAAASRASWEPDKWTMNGDLANCAPEDGNFGSELKSSKGIVSGPDWQEPPYALRIWGEERGAGLAEPHKFSKDIPVNKAK